MEDGSICVHLRHLRMVVFGVSGIVPSSCHLARRFHDQSHHCAKAGQHVEERIVPGRGQSHQVLNAPALTLAYPARQNQRQNSIEELLQ